ncbi:hypothetical protein [Citrobacter freundii]|uniref:hypothetical protein n=2 Tax=Enterobacteriaceae TaxID=543 RepID=UPI003D6E2057
MTTENQHSAPDYAGAHRGMFWGVVKAAISTRQTLYLFDRHYTTKTFLPHQRVTTEGKAMRKVECTVDRFEWNGGERKKVTDTFNGLFHEWGLEYEEFDNGPGNYSVGIVELEDGKVATFPASNIKFLS